MKQNFFSSFFNKDRIEITYGLFCIATVTNSDFYIRIQIDGYPDRFFNYFDIRSISNYLSMIPSNKEKYIKQQTNINTKDPDENIQIDNLYKNWLSLIKNVDKEVLSVHKMNLHSTGFKKYLDPNELGEPKLIFLPEFYNHKYLVQDAKKYRAANIAFNNIDYLIYLRKSINTGYNSAHQIFISILMNHLAESVEKTDYDYFFKLNKKTPELNNLFTSAPELVKSYKIDNILKVCQNWMCLFSDNGKTYRALNKTLMNLPTHIPGGLLCQPPKYHLHKPLTQRLEFLLFFLSNEPYHQKIYKNSRSEQIKKAFKIYCEHLNQKVKYSTSKIYDFIVFLDDYRYEYTGNIIDLTKRAIKWHNENYLSDFEEFNDFSYIENLDKETARPPIPLPINENIKFLSTAKEILEEGRLMRHCVASYIDRAISGQSFLFHIDFNGESATAEINKYGFIEQIKGIENKHNKACDYGMTVLSDWCKKFRDFVKPLKFIRVDYDSF